MRRRRGHARARIPRVDTNGDDPTAGFGPELEGPDLTKHVTDEPVGLFDGQPHTLRSRSAVEKVGQDAAPVLRFGLTGMQGVDAHQLVQIFATQVADFDHSAWGGSDGLTPESESRGG